MTEQHTSQPDELAQRNAQWNRDARWLEAPHGQLLEQFPGQWVAVRSGRVIFHGSNNDFLDFLAGLFPEEKAQGVYFLFEPLSEPLTKPQDRI